MEGSSRSATAGKPIRCKAAVCRRAGEALTIEEIEVDPPKAWEVRIKILCTSLCHSDLSCWKIEAGPIAVFPRILGHEAIGVVESVGEKVDEVEEGDTVIPVFRPHCTECSDCKSSKSNRCSTFAGTFDPGMPRDGTTRFRGSDGHAIHHFLRVSSFSEYTVVDIANVVKVDHSCPVDRACLLSCGVSTGVGAAWKVAGVEEGSVVAIFGLGAVGLAVAEGARIRGASKIIGVDLNPAKFDIGKKFGITDFINPSNCGEKPVSQGCGKTVILGVAMQGTPLNLNTIDLLKGKSVTGCLFGGLKPKVDIPLLVQKYLDKELNLDDFITQHISFQEINKAFDLLIQGKSIRCVMWMDKK